MISDETIELTELLYRALRQPPGLVLRSNAPEYARRRLMRALRAAKEPLFEALRVVVAPLAPDELFIFHSAALPRPTEPFHEQENSPPPVSPAHLGL